MAEPKKTKKKTTTKRNSTSRAPRKTASKAKKNPPAKLTASEKKHMIEVAAYFIAKGDKNRRPAGEYWEEGEQAIKRMLEKQS